MKTIMILAVVLLVVCGSVLIYGCRDKSPVTYMDVGTLVSIDVVPTSFNEHIKCRVETTKGVYIIRGIVSGEKGVLFRKSSNGYLYIGDNPRGSRIIEKS